MGEPTFWQAVRTREFWWIAERHDRPAPDDPHIRVDVDGPSEVGEMAAADYAAMARQARNGADYIHCWTAVLVFFAVLMMRSDAPEPVRAGVLGMAIYVAAWSLALASRLAERARHLTWQAEVIRHGIAQRDNPVGRANAEE